MMCQVTWTSRTFSTSSTVRDVIHANGHSGSNQKSTFVIFQPTQHGAKYSAELSRAVLPASAEWGITKVPGLPRQGSIRSHPQPRCGCAWSGSLPGWQDHRMPGTNLTRDEAATRASLLDVTSYAIDLDLTTSDTTFGSTTTIVFSCREPGASTFADLVGATIHDITLNGEPV